jgi:tryptophanyl-tRNA synthetase
VERNAQENIKDILACGFDPDKTFVFQNTHYIRELYPNVLRIQSHITNSQCFSTFGIKPESNIGQTAFCAIQAAPAMASSFPHLFGHQGTDMDQIHCLIPCGVDQDPYFRLTRDVLPKLGYPKPALICSGFLPALGGVNEKMSSTVPSSAIFLTDTDQQITAKLKKSFSGGRVDKEDHLKHGANLEVDVAYQYLRYFLDDDEELDRITKYYGPDPNYTPKLLSSQVKKHATEVVIALITQHRNKRI